MRLQMIVFFVLMSAILPVLAGCDNREEVVDNVQKDQVKDFYTISISEDTFQIPATYLPDARNRKDGNQETVIVGGRIPSVEPLDNGASYKRFPGRTGSTFSFILSSTKGKKYRSGSLLHHWAKQGHYVVPESWDTEGLVYLGTYMVAGRLKDDVYAYIRDGQPIAQMTCGTYPDVPNPSCTVYQRYRDYVSISPIHFDKNNLEWYATEGIDRILSKVESWRIKPENK